MDTLMASTGAVISAAGFSPTTGNFLSKPRVFISASATTRRSSLAPTTTAPKQQRPAGGDSSVSSKNGSLKKNSESVLDYKVAKKKEESEEPERLCLKDYFEHTKYMLRSDGGPPRWFSPLECGSQLNNSPILFSLPAIDGIGLGLTLQYQRLGQIFDIWCLHIPIDDQTSFPELVKMVERTVRAENYRSPKRPIYLVGESFGGCLALAVAALNPDIDLVLILANPATSFNKSQLQPLIHLLEIIPANLLSASGVPYMLSLMTDSPSKMAIAALEKRLPLQQTVGEISQGVIALSSYLSVMADVLSAESLLWKLKMLKSACAFTNSRLHAVKAQTLVLSSGRDQLLPSREEGERLLNMLPNCEIRTFDNSGHALFLENSIDLVTIIMGASFYRRARNLDYASDYLPPNPSEFKKVYESTSWLEKITSPVMLSTLENGKIVRGLAGIPSEGPVLFVGYHMMLGLELVPLVTRFWIDRNINLRGVAHPMMFRQFNGGSVPNLSSFDVLRVMGAVPVSASNFYRLFSLNSHVLLYPGGIREALHRKGEEYKLFWPEESEFVRMAARFGAKIIPFGAVGEDDIAHLLLDYDDQVKIPFLKSHYERLTKDFVRLRTDRAGEVAKQINHLPVLLPKVPGRFYYLFGAPIETKGRKQELRSKDKAHKVYLEVKSEVERCLAYLKEKRENDPYRSILARLVCQARHGTESEIPTFKL